MSSELLKQIQAGKKLKQAETSDRSAPILDNSKSSPSGGGGSAVSAAASALTGTGPQLGGLFAGGIPKLKPAGQSSGPKPTNLAKPPSIPKREPTSSGSTTRLAPPPRPAPSVPARTVPTVPNGTPLQRAPPPLRASAPAPPARPSPAIPLRPPPTSRSSPALPPRHNTPSPPPSAARPVPAIPPRLPPASPSKAAPNRAPPTTPGRPPPPPPARPPSTGPSSPARAAPPPPSRKLPVGDNGAPALPSRVRTLSAVDSSVVPPPPQIPPRSSVVLSGTKANLAPPPARRVTPSPSDVGRKVPSPPPSAGGHTFPVTDFPPPREFSPKAKHYASGRSRGCNFAL